MADFIRAEIDQRSGSGCPFLPLAVTVAAAALSLTRIAARKASASMARVTCRYRPCRRQRNRRAGQACLDGDGPAASAPRAAVAGASGVLAPNRKTARLWHRHPPRGAAMPLPILLPPARRRRA